MLLHPLVLCPVQPGIEALKDSLIHHLGLSISLRVAHRHELMIDIQVGVELPKCLVIELLPIIHDDGMGETKAVDD